MDLICDTRLYNFNPTAMILLFTDTHCVQACLNIDNNMYNLYFILINIHIYYQNIHIII